MSDCRGIQESIAAGEELPASAVPHLERCAACAALARDVEQLRAAARGLPRPPWPAREVALRALARRGGRGALVLARAQLGPLLAAVALLLLLVGLVLRFAPRGPSRPEPVQADAASIDLFALIDRAQQVWTPAGASKGELAWLKLELPSPKSASVSEIDPLAGLRPAALLISADERNGARSDNPASSPTRGTNPRRKP